MKLPGSLSNLFRPKPETRELILSLLLSSDAVTAASWEIEAGGKPHIYPHATFEVGEDTWDNRIEAADRAISAAEDRAQAPQAIRKVVLGFSAQYLTEEGDIEKEFRPHIRELTKVLELSPVGFVPIHQALAYMLKAEEGIPASVILLAVSEGMVTVTLYKIGKLIGQKSMPRTEAIAADIEAALKGFDGDEVLPSRMLLFGPHASALEEVRGMLLKHPWPTRVNFLHYPKVEILPADAAVRAVSFAGAFELAGAMPVEEETVNKQHVTDDRKEEAQKAEGEESNVRMVNPEELGFQKEDVLEVSQSTYHTSDEETEKKPVMRLPRLPIPRFSFHFPSHIPVGVFPVLVLALVVLAVVWLWYWFLPHTTVTVLVLPKVIKESTTVTVDPTATVADSATKILPGQKQEKVVSGEKTLPVSGKKNVGEEAKGTVTLYNKVTSSRTFKKGTTISAQGLEFTLDDDVSVASASETIGSITFGKASAPVTASQIGPESNLPTGTEFAFKNLATSVVTARNDQPLTGGTSREVTVISRADYDAVVKTLSEELVERAKQELASALGGGQKILDTTVKTLVTEKTFAQELDQESQVVSGKVTIAMTGLSYSEEDLKLLMTELVTQSVPTGYSIALGRTVVAVKSAKAGKDGKVQLSASFESTALPDVKTQEVQTMLAGRRLTSALEKLKAMTGVAGAEFRFRWTPFHDRLPVNKNNISVTVAIQE